MSAKRRLLEQLSRTELLAMVDATELTVTDRRKRDLLVDALSGSRKVRLGELLTTYSRVRLQELARALGLETTGREKSVLIERLTGTAAKK